MEKIIRGTDNADTLAGGAGNNTLQGLGGDDWLDGKAGADLLIGGLGNDTYVVGYLDEVQEAAGGGTDWVYAKVSHVLEDNAENLLLLSTARHGWGNAGDNQLTGNAGHNWLNGRAGADTLSGGAGNDSYVVMDAQDTVIELAGEGVDLIRAGVSYTLSSNVENLTLLGGGSIEGTGNADANVLKGNAGANVLDGLEGDDLLRGGAGCDTLLGGAGNDTFSVGHGDLRDFGISTGSAMQVDGGAGWNTLSLNAPGGAKLDLVAVASATGSGTARLQNIQTVDLSGSGAQQVALMSANVVKMGTANALNSGNAASLGWSDGTYSLQASEARVQVVIEGTAQDVLVKSALDKGNEAWIQVGTLNHAGSTYNVYNDAGGTAQLIVNSEVQFELPVTQVTATVMLSSVAAGSGGFVIKGMGTMPDGSGAERFGGSVSTAGDVNGDGLADLIVGVGPDSYINTDPGVIGRSYVVFGKTDGSPIDMSTLTEGAGTAGFWIAGSAEDWSGLNVSGGGDINGDGLADLLIGAGKESNGTGRAYVVFGKTDGGVVELSAVTAGTSTAGFVLETQETASATGSSVSIAGDVNGDGLADLLVGAPYVNNNAGQSYIIFGKTDGNVVDVSTLTSGTSTAGFVINGAGEHELNGRSVSTAGDVNGDGLVDLIIGSTYGYDGDGRLSFGNAYVVFGKSDGNTVNLSELNSNTSAVGFVINGINTTDVGVAVSAAGDVNGDGLADVIVGHELDDIDGNWAGRSYVVFGKNDGEAVHSSTLVAGTSTAGFVINGASQLDRTGASVSAAGDINGDGLADLLVGAYDASHGTGHSYVIFGKTDGNAVDVSSLTAGTSTAGFVINGQSAGDLSGASVSAAGDVNGDGFDDLIVGASAANNAVGCSYVIFGGSEGVTQWIFDSADGDAIGTSAAETLTGTSGDNQLVAGAGDDTLIGSGGADVLYGGAGDDVIVLNASNLSELGQTGDSQSILRIDGGSGVDTLRIDGAGLTLDLTAVKAPVIQNIDVLDITGSGHNVLVMSLTDVLQLGAANTFSTAGKMQLMIQGNAGDSVTLNDAADWQAAGTATYEGQTYRLYDRDGVSAQLWVDVDVSTNVAVISV